MLHAPVYPVNGNIPTFSSESSPHVFELTCPKPADKPEGTNRFVQLVSAYHQQKTLTNQLRSLTVKLNCTRTYLESPTCNQTLAMANLRHLKTKRCGVLTMLRANRRHAEQLLGRRIDGQCPV
jgi:hypothetical protein